MLPTPIGPCLSKEKQTMPIKHDSDVAREKYREQDPQWMPPPDDTGLGDQDRARRQGGQGVPAANPAGKRTSRTKAPSATKSAPKTKTPSKTKKSKS
jgi:hypothetical protein